MGLPPPKLRDLAAWIKEESSSADIDPREIWEIGVPAKKSLAWSIVLSVLFTESTEGFSNLLKKLSGDESEVNEIKIKKKLTLREIDATVIKQKLNSFNPFKNRHNFFHWKEVSEIVRIFDLRLNRFANNTKPRSVPWNDDWKLKVASKYLQCKIDVYFPDKMITYQETDPSPINIVLFEYENQQHGARKDPINIFNFGMELHQAHDRKLNALKHFFKKAKIANRTINKVVNLMLKPEAHGTAFLPTIMENSCIDILPDIYRSPYIAFKLSEAGFETDPIAQISGKPSPLCYALSCSTNVTYLRILYDYSSNCRRLFDKSVRRADYIILESLEKIKKVVESDISIVNSSNERAVHILKQLNKFIDYQTNIAKDLIDLKNKYKNNEIELFEFRKEIIQVITSHYLTFFRYEDKSKNISQQLNNFMTFPEYYDFTDSFFHISFFDNFFKLKLWFELKYEDILSSDVERKIFLAMKSNIHFPKCHPENIPEVELGTRNIQRSKDILRHIPLHHRNAVESEVKSLLQMLMHTDYSDVRKVRMKLAPGSHSVPHVIDELLINRLNKYLKAVQEISPMDDDMTAVLVIERAMQVIGESIKPPSSTDSIVSFLLTSCLPPKLQKELILIRNDLSKYRSNSVFGKLEIEKDKRFFEGIKEEIKKIQEVFEIVNFTQYSRIEESVMSDCLEKLKGNLESSAYEELMIEYERRLKQRTLHYDKHHRKCMELLLDSFSDLYERSQKTYPNQQLQKQYFFGQLKSIEYLLEFIGKNKTEKYLNDLLNDVRNFLKINKDKYDDEINTLINDNDQLKKMKDNGKTLKEMIKENKCMKETIKGQLENLKEELANFLPKCEKEILKYNTKKDVTLFAPNIESFFESLKKIMFSKEEIEKINRAVEDTLEEAGQAKDDLEDIFKQDFNNGSIQKVEELLKKVLIPHDKLAEIRSCCENRKSTEALKYLNKTISKESIKKDVKKMLEDGSSISGYATTVLTKIMLQRNSDSKYYTTPELPVEICEKLENFLTKKVCFLLNRLKILENILIDDDEEIQATRQWGRSEAIIYHLKFLTRQRYMRHATVCASLEMAYTDCINIFHEPLQKREEEMDDGTDLNNSLAMLYEKSTDLFAGIDLRNLVSHRNNIPEVIGEILDKDDFPSEMVGKILEMIGDIGAIESMLELFKTSGAIEEETFIHCIENKKHTKKCSKKFHKRNSDLMETINDCCRWKEYLTLFPFVKT